MDLMVKDVNDADAAFKILKDKIIIFDDFINHKQK